METLIHLDKEIFLFLNNLGNPAWDTFWLTVTNKWMAIPLYALLLYLIFRKLGLKATALTLVVIAVMIACSDQLANVFKHAVERPRPCRQEGVMESMRFIAVRCGLYGYYSAHASNSMALALFLGMVLKKQYPKLIYFLLFWAFLVGYSRIYIGVHYPLDVLSGLAMGTLLGFIFAKLQPYLLKKFRLTLG